MKSQKNNSSVSRILLVNGIAFIALIFAGYFLTTTLLNNFTHHGQSIPVPDLSGMKVTKLESVLAEHHFIPKVVDSLYDPDKAPGTVLDQDPAPESKVKENRTIYLTINATQPPDVKMPDLIDVSYRQAEAILESFGLVSGEITYRSDLAKNAVLEQRYKNAIIKPGRMIPKGSQIDLVLGDGLGEIEIVIPDLNGLSRFEAWSALKRANLNLGDVHYNAGVDSAEARVYRQNPPPEEGNTIKAGDPVDIYLR
jgi:beta-lactam-binding protein with PASTA domain